MAKQLVLKDDTSRIEYLFIQNNSVTTGAGLTGLAYNTASLTAYYVRTQGSATSITLATQTVTGAYSSGGFVEVDATNMPGVYRFDPPNAVFATGVDKAVIILKGATNMAPVVLEYQLVGFDPEDAVRLGLTALPNAAAQAAGGLYTRGTGAGQINQPANGVIDANAVQWAGAATATDDLALKATLAKGTDITGFNDLSAAQVNTEVDTALADARLDELLAADSDIDGAAPPTVGSVFHELMSKTAGSFTFDQTTDSLEAVRDNMGTPQTGDSFARLGAPAGASVSADIAAIEAQTDDIGAAGAGLTAVPWNAAWDAEVQSEVQDALEANNLDHLVGTATGIPALPAGTYLDQALDDGTATFDRTTDSLQAIRDNQGTAQTGDSFARLGAPAGASVSADVAAVKAETAAIVADTNELQTDWANGGRLDLLLDGVKAKTDTLPSGIQKNTALNNFAFLMVDSADHITPKTGLTITAQRSLDGGAFGACANSATEVGNGIYKINLAAGDLNGDTVVLRFTGTGADARLLTVITEP